MNSQTLNAMAQALQHGQAHQTAEPDPLQPTSLFLDHANRDVRRHFCILNDEEGSSFFLRPDFTLPICSAYAKQKKQAAERYFYHGKIWRWNIENNARAQQAQMGIEHIGAQPASQTAAQIINATYQALACAGYAKPFLRMGDPALFDQLVNGLELPQDWKTRLQKRFRRNTGLSLFFQQAQQTMKSRVHNTAEIECHSVEELKAFLQKNQIEHIGQRSLDEIAERLREQNALHHPELPQQIMQLIKNFLNLEDAHPEKAIDNITSFAKSHSLNFDQQLENISQSWDAMKAAPLAKILTEDNVSFSTHFQGAHLSYYTGFVFAFLADNQNFLPLTGGGQKALPLAGGGQYNGLMKALGSNQSGFGATIYLDELS